MEMEGQLKQKGREDFIVLMWIFSNRPGKLELNGLREIYACNVT